MQAPMNRRKRVSMRHGRTSNLRLSRPHGGFTLVELLVAMAVTLILILALSQAFALVGQVVAEGRAAIEMAGSVRGVAHRLQEDLDGVTVPVRPWADEGAAGGYFEIIDGPSTDMDWNANDTIATDLTAETIFGDVDDILAFTARSKGSPFVGEVGGESVQSTLAEIVWWIQNEDGSYDPDVPFTIYRRVMLIRPDLGPWDQTFATTEDGLRDLRTYLHTFFNINDISVRTTWAVANNEVTVRMSANSLADLTRRENRFGRARILSDRASPTDTFTLAPVAADAGWPRLQRVYPHPMDLNGRSVTSLYRMPKTGAKAGEDVMLSNALAFDVRVFDPTAPLYESTNAGEALAPGDPGYFPRNAAGAPQVPTADQVGRGAFVDLGYGNRPTAPGAGAAANWSSFSGPPRDLSGLQNAATFGSWPYVYCTWSTHYERDGLYYQDGVNVSPPPNTVPDAATDGFDRDGQDGVDSVSERQTSPPYPVPLRGIHVTIRAYEPDTRQIRQVSVVTDFVPE